MDAAALLISGLNDWLTNLKRTILRTIRALATGAAWELSDYCDGLIPVAAVRLRTVVIMLQSSFAPESSALWGYRVRRIGAIVSGAGAALVLTVAPAGAVHQSPQFVDVDAAFTAGAASPIFLNTTGAADVTLSAIPGIVYSIYSPRISLPPENAVLTGSGETDAGPGDVIAGPGGMIAGSEEAIADRETAIAGAEDAIAGESVNSGPSLKANSDKENTAGSLAAGTPGAADDDPALAYGAGIVSYTMAAQADSYTMAAPADQIETLAYIEQGTPTGTQGAGSGSGGSSSDIQVSRTQLSSTDSTGVYIWPANGTLSSRYGSRSATVGSTNHKGVDITGLKGDPIYAADGGVVIVSGWSRSFGYVVQIRHDNGHITLYSHCSELLVDVDEMVAQGQQIARMGRTGLASGVHLHFELLIDGKNVNPMKYLTID